MVGANDTSWAPNETAATLWVERSMLAGFFVGAVAYGVLAMLFFITLSLLWSRTRKTRNDYGWIAYIVSLFILSSIGNGTQLKVAEMIFIDDRDYPGGPAFFPGSGMVGVFCNSVYIVNTWFQDGLLLYRFWIIFGSGYIILALPALIYFTSIALGILMMVMLTRPGGSIWEGMSYQIFTAYFSVSIAFNILLTIAIVSRLLLTRRRIGKVLGSTSPHVSVAAMLIESSFLYSAWGIAFLVAYGLHSPVENLILPTLAQIQSIAPLLIIMRVAQGQAWSSKTTAHVGSTVFSFRKKTGLQSGGATNTVMTLASGAGGASATQLGTMQTAKGSDSDIEKVWSSSVEAAM